MEGITREALELVREGAPEFIRQVEIAVEQGRAHRRRGRLSLTLEAFFDDPMLLHASLWFGATQGVTIVFTPPASLAGRLK